MEGLNREFLLLALKNRYSVAFGDEYRNQGFTSPADIPDETVNIISDPVWEKFLPDWEGDITVFREVFSFLYEISSQTKVNDDNFIIEDTHVSEWLKQNTVHFETEYQLKTFKEFVSLCSGDYKGNPLKLDDLKSMAGYTDSDESFKADVANPLAKSGLLVCHGQPELDLQNKSFDRYVGPYSPGLKTRLTSFLG